MIAFAPLVSGGNSTTPPVFGPVNASSVVFGPESTFDAFGTEDPRILRDPASGTYYMFYTSYGRCVCVRRSRCGLLSSPVRSVFCDEHTRCSGTILLSLATTKDPTSSNWTRYGPVFADIQGSKSAAMILPTTANGEQYYLLWGSGTIRIANSSNPRVWPDAGPTLLAPRSGSFDSQVRRVNCAV